MKTKINAIIKNWVKNPETAKAYVSDTETLEWATKFTLTDKGRKYLSEESGLDISQHGVIFEKLTGGMSSHEFYSCSCKLQDAWEDVERRVQQAHENIEKFKENKRKERQSVYA